MRLLPDASRGRPLAILLLLIAILAIYLGLVHWWFTAPLLAARADLIDLRDQEQRMRLTAQQRPAIEQRLEEVRAFEQQNPGFLPEANFDLAASALITRLRALVETQNAGEGCSVVSSTPFRSRDEEPFLRVTVKVRMRCEVEFFAPVLHGLESGSPQLFITELNANARRALVNRPDAPQQNGYLDFSFDLYGYLRMRGGSQ